MDRNRSEGSERDPGLYPGADYVREGDVTVERGALIDYEGTTEAGGTSAGRSSEAVFDTASGQAGRNRDFVAGTGGATRTNITGDSQLTQDPATPPGVGAVSGSGTGMTGSAINDLVARIHEGMKVVDANGDTVGKVDEVRMGDPQAVTTAGQEGGDLSSGSGMLGTVGDTLFTGATVPDVPEPLRSQLVRAGYIKVGKGWFSADRYLTADMIADVTDDEVRLRVTRDQIPSG